MLIFDGDYPLAYGGMELNRYLTQPLEDVRTEENNPANVPFSCLPE